MRLRIVYSLVDLKLKGKGILYVSSSYNGIHTKDDLEIRDDSALLFMSSLYFDNTWRLIHHRIQQRIFLDILLGHR